jgi:hypothetical protein
MGYRLSALTTTPENCTNGFWALAVNIQANNITVISKIFFICVKITILNYKYNKVWAKTLQKLENG